MATQEPAALDLTTVSATDLARDTKRVRKLVSDGPVLVTRRGRIVGILSPTSQVSLARDFDDAFLASAEYVPARELSREGPGRAFTVLGAGRPSILTEHNKPFAVLHTGDDLARLRTAINEAFADVEVPSDDD